MSRRLTPGIIFNKNVCGNRLLQKERQLLEIIDCCRIHKDNVVYEELSSEEQFRDAVALLRKQGVEHLFFAGGDGTISTCINALYVSGEMSKVVITPVMMGTGNGLRYTFGLRKNPVLAVADSFLSKERTVDLLVLQTDTGLERVGFVSGVGFDGWVSQRREEMVEAKANRHLSYYCAGREAVIEGQYKPLRFIVCTENGYSAVEDVWTVIVNKSPFWGTGVRVFEADPRTALVDEHLHYLPITGGKGAFYSRFARAMILNDLGYGARAVKEIDIVAKDGAIAQVDGVPLDSARVFSYRVLNRALRLKC